MIFWFWLPLLGLITYFIVQRSVASMTRTPVWLLWLVMMMPAFIWALWGLAFGPSRPIPTVLIIGPFVACPLLYWMLLQWGRISPEEVQMAQEEAIAAAKRPPLRPIEKDEEATLQNCFPWTVFYLQNIEYRPQAVICRGQLRTNPEAAYATVRDNVVSHFGDRFLVVFQESLQGKPFFALVPNSQAMASRLSAEPLIRPGLALSLLVATLLTTTWVGISLNGGLAEEQILTLEQLAASPDLWLRGLPYAIALMGILGIHEMGHYLAARFYKIRTTLPYFIPVPLFLGTFGAFIQIRSPVPNRKALFDVGIAGPLAGLAATLPVLLWGLAHSTIVARSPEANILQFDALNPHTSLLLSLLSHIALGSNLTATAALKLHPVAIAGYIGLLVTALNLMPVGQLDGGHIVHAMFGQRTGAAIGQVARFLVLLLSFVRPELLMWAILLFFIPVIDEPALNDVSELDNRRDLWGLLALGLLVMIVLPAPKILTELLSATM